MYTNRPIRRRNTSGRSILNGVGLGEDIDTRAIDKEYRGATNTGQTVVPLVSQVFDMFGKATGTGLIVGMVPGKLTKSVGIDVNPASLVLAPVTFGASLLPGVSQVLGKVFNVFGGLFKKATHMGDCMKWWQNESNLRSAIGGIQPIPMTLDFSFESHMMKNYPQFLRQYQILRAGGQWESVGVDRYLDSVRGRLNASARYGRLVDTFIQLMRENSDIMKADCATQQNIIAQQGDTGILRSDVMQIIEAVRQYARQREYEITMNEISKVGAEIDRLVSPFKVKETWGEIVRSREKNLLVKREQGANLAIPGDVIAIKNGAFVMSLKSEQTSNKPVMFGK